MTQAGAGSREAFDELVRRYRRSVYNLVRALSSGDNEAEDLVQDIFVRAYRAIGGFRGDSTFRSWLYRISVNVVHSHRDRRRVARGLQANGRDGRAGVDGPDGVDGRRGHGGPAGPAGIDGIAAPGNLEETFALRRAIDQALATLPEDMRVLIVLRDVQGLKYEEIAKIVKIPRGTVDSRLFRARQRLRPLLEAYMTTRPPAAAAIDADAQACKAGVGDKDNDP